MSKLMSKLDDALSPLYLLGAFGIGTYAWVQYDDRSQAEKLISEVSRGDIIRIDKELSKENRKVGTRTDGSGKTHDVTERVFCLRVEREDRVSGNTNKAYYVVNISQKYATQISEYNARGCVTD